MGSKINIKDVFDKNLNFLIGSGASNGVLPTLKLSIKDAEGDAVTIESLATSFEQNGRQDLKALLFMHYYKTCIKPALGLDRSSLDPDQIQVLEHYKMFIQTILEVMERRESWDQKCNLFTTNYDSCVEIAVDDMLSTNKSNFILNDGSQGFLTRYLNAKNFNTYAYQTGIFDRHSTSIPQINLIHLHGSIFWRKEGKDIVVDHLRYKDVNSLSDGLFPDELSDFSSLINNDEANTGELDAFKLDEATTTDFWTAYRELPIVNPTKWKFHETLFEEHYYQMLRLLSYELEKPNSILITFGFSFADEHILRLVQRSLSNPKLQLFICCYSESQKNSVEDLFQEYKNVEIVHIEEPLNFEKFNSAVFTLIEDEKGPEAEAE